MVAYIYDKLVDKGIQSGQIPNLTRSARNWFRDLARTTRGVQPRQIITSAPKTQMTKQLQVGFMYQFFYNPKTKDDLPYYDTFPLIFPFKQAFTRSRAAESGAFYGINLHYLDIRLRARLMDSLYTISSDKKYDEDTRIRLSYKMLNSASKFRFFKPCIKKYLMSHVRGRFVKINANAWDVALFLPTERFKKANKGKVHRESRKMII